eukprot:CAMPEP_0172719440 /NCGR_PEP_ID=MMETSP1074-20121228/75502_1 /TAXON_ID=2916 /ORGANISM="Ceratium fusus, Strain PA161109" /LENGTH=218 /DNA_ID=CAMNT_0013544791 /DNA_START=294 /DNA_END=950 /DNA_ORIENTATION=+
MAAKHIRRGVPCSGTAFGDYVSAVATSSPIKHSRIMHAFGLEAVADAAAASDSAAPDLRYEAAATSGSVAADPEAAADAAATSGSAASNLVAAATSDSAAPNLVAVADAAAASDPEAISDAAATSSMVAAADAAATPNSVASNLRSEATAAEASDLRMEIYRALANCGPMGVRLSRIDTEGHPSESDSSNAESVIPSPCAPEILQSPRSSDDADSSST